MKMFLDEFKVLDMSELIAVNGGYGSSSSEYGGSSSGYSGNSGGYGSNTSGYATNSSYNALTSGLEGKDYSKIFDSLPESYTNYKEKICGWTGGTIDGLRYIIDNFKDLSIIQK